MQTLETLTINKNNWTGEEATITVNREEKYIEIPAFGETVRYYMIEKNAEIDLNFRDFWLVEDPNDTDSDVRGWFYDGVYEFEAYSRSRANKDWAIAAAQILFNIL